LQNKKKSSHHKEMRDFLTIFKLQSSASNQKKGMVGPFTLDSVETNAIGTKSFTKEYDVAIIAKPTIFGKERQVLDQYNGGKIHLAY
jgi:hypothetical protein